MVRCQKFGLKWREYSETTVDPNASLGIVERLGQAFGDGIELCVRAGLLAAVLSTVSVGQDLAPRAYVITPAGSNAVTLQYSYNSGSVFVDPSLPVDSPKVQFQIDAISYYHSYGLFGHASNIAVLLPYVVANAEGTVAGIAQQIYRSGLADSHIRFALNLMGGAVMSPREFASWHEKTLIGVSFSTTMPTGQYDPARLINLGANRWAFKPEIAVSRRRGRLAMEAYGGVWLFTRNRGFSPGNSLRTEKPIGATEMHLTYYVKPRLWFSLDGNFWIGGRTTVNGIENEDEQRNSRAGVTAAIPINPHQSVKASYATGAYATIGGNYRTISVAWQYSWFGKPE
jgi:hypothetical protein